MRALLTAFHPSFDALSAHADLSDLDGARSRIGRHVARCEGCRATIAEIRAMGEAARAVEVPTAPAGLWESIERARRTGPAVPVAAPAGTAPVADVAPMASCPAVTAVGRRMGVALLAAAGLFGVLLLPSPTRTLQASPERGRWRFTPARPAAGEVVQVRFEPPASFPPMGQLLLLAHAVPSWRYAEGWEHFGMGLLDSVATLTKAGDGSYVGRFRTESSFAAMNLQLAAPGGGLLPVGTVPTPDRFADGLETRKPMALLVVRGRDGRPSLEALSSVVAVGGLGPRAGTGGYSVADTLIRYYPAEPIGYAADHRVGGQRLLDDVIAWFHRGEREYTRFAEGYARQPSVSADRELAMVMLGERIAEPTEARGWVRRLVRDHPDDPRALLVYAQMLTGMFNEPGTLPLIRHGLPLADTLWERNGHRGPASALASVARRAGDAAAVLRWSTREWRSPVTSYPFIFALDDDLLRDRSAWPDARPYLERQSAVSCVLPPGRYPLSVSSDFWRSMCAGGRRDAFAQRSALARLQGDPRTALALADSAIGVPGFGGSCYYLSPQQRRGEALLAVGDTAAALRELALRAARETGRSYADSVYRAVRTNVDSASWGRALAAGRDSLTRCWASSVARQRADAARRRAAGAPPYYR